MAKTYFTRSQRIIAQRRRRRFRSIVYIHTYTNYIIYIISFFIVVVAVLNASAVWGEGEGERMGESVGASWRSQRVKLMNELLMRVNYYNNWHHFSVQSIQEEMIGGLGG